MNNILVHFDIPNMNSKQYDQTWVELRARGQSKPKGLLHHFGGQQGNNWVVVDVWESIETFNKFGETFLLPIFVKLGIPPVQPVITSVHYHYNGV